MREGLTAPAHGNAAVVALFERYLERAKLGKVNYGTATVAEYPDVFAFDCAGAVDMVATAEVALNMLQRRIIEAQINRLPPEPDPDLTADHVCFNLAAGAVGYDFVPWLIDAEMERVREGAPAPLKVAFYMGLNGTSGLNSAYRQQMLERVLWPLLPMIGAVEDPAAMRGRCKPCYHFQDVVVGVNKGERVPCLQPSPHARQTIKNYMGIGPAPVTITLREAPHWPHRNSNMDAWCAFARMLEQQGEHVVFVRDSGKAHEPLPGFATFSHASVDIDMRCALYAHAKCNMFVSNGPWNIALFGTRPWLMFCEINDSDEFEPNRSDWWDTCSGIKAREQMPWSTPDQRIIWQRDDYDNLVQAWHQLQDMQAEIAA